MNQPPGEPRRGKVPALWDFEQARAYAAGDPVPEIDAEDHPADLLDDREVADIHELTTRQFHRIVTDNRISLTIPDPDAAPCGVAHWKRATAEAMHLRVAPNEFPRYGPRAERRETLEAVARAMAKSGEPINISELARRAGVSRMTARAYVIEHHARASSD